MPRRKTTPPGGAAELEARSLELEVLRALGRQHAIRPTGASGPRCACAGRWRIRRGRTSST
ncbi:MAG: hypothetical protein ABL957_15425, partial [Parvularculaceae bacterium]